MNPLKAGDLTTQARRIFERWILLACFACLPVHAQDTQFLPEIDAHLTFNHYVRGYLQAKDDREGGDPTQFTFGPSIEFFLKPLIKLKSVTLFDLDDAKSRPLVLESGWRRCANTNGWKGIEERFGFVKVSVADVRVEHQVKIADFMKWLERPGRTPREITHRLRIRAILGMSVSR